MLGPLLLPRNVSAETRPLTMTCHPYTTTTTLGISAGSLSCPFIALSSMGCPGRWSFVLCVLHELWTSPEDLVPHIPGPSTLCGPPAVRGSLFIATALWCISAVRGWDGTPVLLHSPSDWRQTAALNCSQDEIDECCHLKPSLFHVF